MYRVISTFAVLFAIVFYFIGAPAASYGYPAKPVKDSGVCRINGKKECHHKACTMSKGTMGHRHGGSTAHAGKVFFKCGCAGDGALHPASFHEIVFLLPDTDSLNGRDGVSFIPEYIAPCQKDPSLPVEIPPKIIAPSSL